MRSRRTLLRYGGGAVGALLLLGALLEATARVHLFGWAGLDPRRVDSVKPIDETGYLQLSPDARIRYTLRPDVDGWFKLARFRTNARALRDGDYAIPKPANAFRIVVSGSSFTLPSGVAIEDAFHSRLEARLSAASTRGVYEFVNLAVGAHAPTQMLAMLRRHGLAYEPDLVLFDVTRLSAPGLLVAADRTLAGAVMPPVSHPFFSSFLWRLVRARLGRVPEVIPPLARPDSQGGSASVAARLGALARSQRVPVVVVLLEFDPAQPVPDPAIEAAVRDAGLRWLDTRSAFAGSAARDLWIHPLDPHPNARAHAIFADAVEAYLRAEGLLPE